MRLAPIAAHAADGLYHVHSVEVEMSLDHGAVAQAARFYTGSEAADLPAIALLCLLLAWPAGDNADARSFPTTAARPSQ
ncbi:MAG TPA: hypothetical protein VMD48_08575 [Solirubrobacteraceae bacterium]|nr:hypothetical protein [Solirubrobacteraceae bacterium]